MRLPNSLQRGRLQGNPGQVVGFLRHDRVHRLGHQQKPDVVMHRGLFGGMDRVVANVEEVESITLPIGPQHSRIGLIPDIIGLPLIMPVWPDPQGISPCRSSTRILD